MSSDRSRLTAVDGLRGLAAMMVVTHHVFLTSTTDRLGALDFSFLFLRSGVDLFFVISGFCLFYPLTKPGSVPNWREFYFRRARRILPPYYAAMASVILLPFIVAPVARRLGLSVFDPSWPSWQQVYAHLFMIHTLLPATFWGLTGPFWSLGVEVQLYLMFPLAVGLVYRFGPRGIILMALITIIYRSAVDVKAGAPVSLAFFQGGNSLLSVQTNIVLGRWLEFGVGMFTAQLVRRRSMRSMAAGTEALLMAGAICLYIGAQVYQFRLDPADRWPPPIVDCLLASGFSIVLLVACTPRSYAGRVLGHRLPVAVGTISYSLYLTHYAVLSNLGPSIVALHLSKGATFVALGVLGVPLAFACATLFFHVFERPFLAAARAVRVPVHPEQAPALLAQSTAGILPE